MSALERRYRQLLRAYPRAYRRERGEELIGTLMELSRPGQQWPAPREARAMLLAGIRIRAGVDQLHSTAAAWLDGARAALVLMLAWQLIMQLWLVASAQAELPPGEWVSGRLIGESVVKGIIAGTAVALLSARYRLGFALALLTPLPSVIPPFANTWDNLYAFQLASWWLPVIGLSVPLLRRPAATGPWRWLLAIPLLVLASTLLPLFGQGLAALGTALAMLALCLAWGAVIDPRPAIALGLLLLTVIPQLVVSMSVLVIAVPIFLLLGSALLAAGALRAQRRFPA
ncbi:hypothetical protein [Micromonospora eburnea]|uniref:Uncharacterized protein n=1 Tax=Micromonospora eburnea TaxID=227316 RepID=A0A1C6V2D8_9ACTN|nr:hypothetical protein [Micromonospora eburnea]SCL60455.1 hypothetical protein GA0070604_4301 [Micromonospora eburnea]